MARLLLIRHGQTPSNVDGVLDAAPPGPGLTELGRRQAAALRDRLVAETVTRVVASTLARAVETAQPLAEARELPVGTDAGLREVSAGRLEGRRDAASHREYLETVFAWASGDLGARIPGSEEDGHDFFARFDRAIDTAVRRADGTVAVVSHGASIRTWASVRAGNLPDDHGRDRGLPNTGMVVLEGEPGAWRALQWQEDRFGDAEDDPTGAGGTR